MLWVFAAPDLKRIALRYSTAHAEVAVSCRYCATLELSGQ
jgi:hypothetical protein